MYDEFRNAARGEAGEQTGSSAKLTLTVNVEKYQSMLDGTGMSDTEKEQVLQALWSLIVNFVALGFEVHPFQEACGKNCKNDTATCANSTAEVSSLNTEFDDKSENSVP